MKQPHLYLFMGYPGAGKTTIARLIAETTGAEHIWADVERHKAFGQPTHTEAESKQLYADLNDRTDELLRQGKSVVFDTNFNFFADRELLRNIATQAGAIATLVWVNTPAAVAKERAVHSQVVRNGYDFAMSADQFDAIAAKLEPPRPSEQAVVIDGSDVSAAYIKQQLGI